MALSDVVNVQVTRGTKSVTQAGFGAALILGSVGASFGTDKFRSYTSLAGVLSDFLTTDPVYKAAARLFGQQKKPRKVVVGRKNVNVAQVVTMTPDVSQQMVNTYVVTIDGVDYSFTGDATPTAAEVVTGLTALINADANCRAFASGTNTLILTADDAGLGFSAVGKTRMAGVLTTANVGVPEDLQAIRDTLGGDDWYMLIITSRADTDILAAADYIESAGSKMFLACNSSAAVLTSSTTDIASRLKAKNYARTAFLFSNDQASYPEAAWAGDRLPFSPGSENWKFASPSGVVADDALTATQITYLKLKNANWFQTVAGVAIMQPGKVAANEWIDTIRFIDWLQAQIAENVFAALVSAAYAPGKIPFTDAGVAIIEGVVRAQLKRGQRVGGLAESPAFVVSFPKVASVAVLDRQNRHLPDGQFQATLAGAINDIDISGTVSV